MALPNGLKKEFDMEIEKKYLIINVPDNLTEYPKKEIEQGYLNRKPVVRIRKSNDDYILTYKGKPTGTSSETAICNSEIEAALTEEAYYHLREKIDNHVVSKTRYIIPIGTAAHNCPGMDLREIDDDGKPAGDAVLKIELDVFHERLEGLCFAEVEFPTISAAEHFSKPEWFGEDVSMDSRYHNGHLSEIEKLDDM